MRWLVVVMTSLAACNGDSPSGACTANSGCASGEVCISGACSKLCHADSECAADEICDGTVCVVGARSGAPTISSIDGTGSPEDATVDPRGVRTARHLRDSITVRGANLEGASLWLVPGAGTAIDLTPSLSAPTEVTALLPTSIAEGLYALRAANAVGEDQTDVWLLRGETGAEGAPRTASEVLALLLSLGDPVPGLRVQSAATAAALTDLGGASHAFEELAMAEDGVPAGAVMHFAMNTCPAGWTAADGQIASRASFTDLFAAIGETYGAGDGSTTFGKPDLRGEFVRGWDDGRGLDTGRNFATTQGSATRLLMDTWFSSLGGLPAGTSDADRALIGHDPSVQWVGIDYPSAGPGTFTSRRSMSPVMDSTFGNAAETRPRNLALLACIKF